MDHSRRSDLGSTWWKAIAAAKRPNTYSPATEYLARLSHNVAVINATTEANETHVRLGISSSSESDRSESILTTIMASSIALVTSATTLWKERATDFSLPRNRRARSSSANQSIPATLATSTFVNRKLPRPLLPVSMKVHHNVIDVLSRNPATYK